jgi:hypothetical protein
MKVRVIGGLFEDQAALRGALATLNSRGYQDLAYSIVGTALRPPEAQQQAGGGEGLFRALRRMGIGGAQAQFYVRGILRGQMLLVMHGVDADSLNAIQMVLQQQGAQFVHQG